jgi:Flp pilus assembly protein TadD
VTARPALVALLACAACADASDHAAEAGPLAVADSLRLEGRFAEALPHYRALRDSLAASPDLALRWRAETGWAEMLLRTGRLDSARASLDDARALAGGGPRRVART